MVIDPTKTVLGTIINQGDSTSNTVPMLKPSSSQIGQRPLFALAAMGASTEGAAARRLIGEPLQCSFAGMTRSACTRDCSATVASLPISAPASTTLLVPT